MKKTPLILLLVSAVLLAVILSAGCVEESAAQESTSQGSQVQQVEKPAELQQGTPDRNPGNNETLRDEMPLNQPDMPMDGSMPLGIPPNGTPPSDLQMEGRYPLEMPNDGTPPSGMPSGEPPVPGMQ